VFEPSRAQVTAGWRQFYNKQPLNLYFSPNIWAIELKRMGWAEHISRMGGMINALKMFVGKLGRSDRCRE
jgi:hypothetical protein